MSSNSDILFGMVKLVRNYRGLHFRTESVPEQGQMCIRLVTKALQSESNYILYRCGEMNERQKQLLCSKKLVTRNWADCPGTGAVLIRQDSQASIMLNENDNVQMRILSKDFNLTEATEEAFRLEKIISEETPFSYDEQIGYLTSDPTEAGTGLKACFILHLPVLDQAKQISALQQKFGKIGLKIEPVFPEAAGQVYLLSHRAVLGRTEAEILQEVTAGALQLSSQENEAREQDFSDSRLQREDSSWRAYAALRYSRLMEEKEFFNLWSSLRIGILDEIVNIPLSEWNALLMRFSDAQLAFENPSVENLAMLRSNLLHSFLNSYIEGD